MNIRAARGIGLSANRRVMANRISRGELSAKEKAPTMWRFSILVRCCNKLDHVGIPQFNSEPHDPNSSIVLTLADRLRPADRESMCLGRYSDAASGSFSVRSTNIVQSATRAAIKARAE